MSIRGHLINNTAAVLYTWICCVNKQPNLFPGSIACRVSVIKQKRGFRKGFHTVLRFCVRMIIIILFFLLFVLLAWVSSVAHVYFLHIFLFNFSLLFSYYWIQVFFRFLRFGQMSPFTNMTSYFSDKCPLFDKCTAYLQTNILTG